MLPFENAQHNQTGVVTGDGAAQVVALEPAHALPYGIRLATGCFSTWPGAGSNRRPSDFQARVGLEGGSEKCPAMRVPAVQSAGQCGAYRIGCCQRCCQDPRLS